MADNCTAATNNSTSFDALKSKEIQGTIKEPKPSPEIARLQSLVEAPVFYPTAKEFSDPAKYIEAISETVRPFGICKIVPPTNWKPPFMLDREKFSFRTRVQQVNFLDGQARLRLTFVENLCRFMAKRGTPLERLPVVDYQVLDLCRLFREVNKRGGMVSVSEDKRWAEVARTLGLQASSGSVIRQHYQKMLHPYELYKKRDSEEVLSKPTMSASSTPALNSADSTANSATTIKEEASLPVTAVKAEVEVPNEVVSSVSPEKLAAKAESSAAIKSEDGGEPFPHVAKAICGAGPGAGPEAYRLVRAPDGACRVMAAGEAGLGGGGGGKGEDDEDDEEFAWTGYHDGRRYTLAEYEEMADKFRADRFPDGAASEAEVRPRRGAVADARPTAGSEESDNYPGAGREADSWPRAGREADISPGFPANDANVASAP